LQKKILSSLTSMLTSKPVINKSEVYNTENFSKTTGCKIPSKTNHKCAHTEEVADANLLSRWYVRLYRVLYILGILGSSVQEYRLYRVFHFKWYGRLSRESMILFKNFSNESCMVWKGTHDGNMDLTLSKSGQDYYCFFFNENSYFLLHILVTYPESFPKHYNKVTYWVLSELWGLKVTVLSVLSMYACVWAGFLRARVSAIVRDSFFFQFFYMGFFKALFKMAA